MKKVLTIGGISLVLLTILGIGVFAKGDNSDRLYYKHHHEHNYQECMNDNINSHHHGHHNHHQYYNCK